jgi:hypothetical protein
MKLVKTITEGNQHGFAKKFGVELAVKRSQEP